MGKRDMRPQGNAPRVREWAAKVQDAPGSVAEFGIYRGGMALILCQLFPGRAVHLFDSCKGLPATRGPHDGEKSGHFCGREDDVRSVLAAVHNWTLHKGWFADVLRHVETGPLAFVHVDCDYESSYRDCLPYILHRLSPGGVVLLDDVGYARCKGADVACDDLLGNLPGYRKLKGGGAVYQSACEAAV